MTRPGSRPPHPWSGAEAPPDRVCALLGRLLRGEDATLASDPGGNEAASRAVECLISRHRGGPYLRYRLEGSPVFEALPARLRERLDDSVRRQDAAAARALAATDHLRGAVLGASIPFVVLKGIGLAHRVFGGVAGRAYGDLDVLVPEADREAACRALERAGFRMVSSVFLSEALTARFVHAFDFERDGHRLDLHWSLSRLPGLRTDAAALFGRAETIAISGRTLLVPSLEDELAFVLISSFADIQRGALRLQSFIDVFALLRAQPDIDWGAFFERRRGERVERICRATLSLFLSALGLHASFPALHAALGAGPSAAAALAVLGPSPGAWRGKAWGAGHLPAAPSTYAAWWAVSLPFRAAGSHPRLQRRAQGAKP